jgi:hypothetical protein
MDFLKKHYEKILLGVVLLGLAVAVGFLPFKIASEKENLERMNSNLSHPKVPPLSALDLTQPSAALQRLAAPAAVNFSEPNKLFNPMPWQRTADGRLIPGTKVGPGVVTLTNLTPLYLVLTLAGVTPSDLGPRYNIVAERQAAPNPKDRYKKQYYSKLNDKNDLFTLIDVQGAPDDPSKLVVQLNDTGEKAVITKDQPFKRVDGYMVTLNYDPEHKTWKDRRVNATFVFNFEEYKIVTINQNEVVLSATSNQKKWTIKYNPVL